MSEVVERSNMSIEFIADYEGSMLKGYTEDSDGRFIFISGDQPYIVSSHRGTPLAGLVEGTTNNEGGFYIYAAIGKRATYETVLQGSRSTDPHSVDNRPLGRRLVVDKDSPDFLVTVTNVRNPTAHCDIRPKKNHDNVFILLNSKVAAKATLNYLQDEITKAMENALYRV